jgi:hypothetical protein
MHPGADHAPGRGVGRGVGPQASFQFGRAGRAPLGAIATKRDKLRHPQTPSEDGLETPPPHGGNVAQDGSGPAREGLVEACHRVAGAPGHRQQHPQQRLEPPAHRGKAAQAAVEVLPGLGGEEGPETIPKRFGLDRLRGRLLRGPAHKLSRRPGRGSTTTSWWRRTACSAAPRCEKTRSPAAAVGSPKTCRRQYFRPTNQLLSKWHCVRHSP